MPRATLLKQAITRQDAVLIGVGLLALCLLYAVSGRLFDVACELAFVLGAACVLETARTLRRFARDDYPLFLALGLAAAAALQLAHTATYPYLHLLAAASADLTEQLQLAAGLVLCGAMLAAPLVAGRRLRLVPLVGGFGLLTALLLTIAFRGVLPSALTSSGARTPFAITTDVVVAAGLALAALLTHARRRHLEPALALAVEAALALAALGWLGRAFIVSDDFTHLLNVVFVALLYVAVSENGLARPTALLVAELEEGGRREAAAKARALAQLRDSEARYRTVFEQSPAGLVLFDRRLVVRRCNARLCQLLHAAEEAIVGSDLHDLASAELVAQISAALDGRLGAYEGPLRNTYDGGGELFISARTAPLEAAGDDACVGIATIVDLSESKRAEELIERLAFRDSLTGLANRTLLRDRLRQALLATPRGGASLAVLHLDLERFADANHLLGHAGGDTVLQAVAERLGSAVRESDTVARWGGDEFMILLPEARGTRGATRAAAALARALATPLEVDGHQITPAAHMGIALFPADGVDAETLLEHAALATARAKAAESEAICFYDGALGREVYERLVLEDELHSALREGEFVLYYQPQVELESLHTIGVEALVRWQHPHRGLLPPAAFLPVAEATGLIEELTAWVAGEACRQAAAWQDAGHAVRVAVNLSARDFRGGSVLETIDAALGGSDLPAQLLEVELTETAAVEDIEATARQLERLGERGVSAALDDFGTGYSSLSHLSRLPISRVKIDRSFVTGIAEDARKAAIVDGMVELIHSLGLEAIAEGVESESELAFLRGCGCDLGQGYLFARPLPPDECEEFLARQAAPLELAAGERHLP